MAPRSRATAVLRPRAVDGIIRLYEYDPDSGQPKLSPRR